jgi:hypothetical protein
VSLLDDVLDRLGAQFRTAISPVPVYDGPDNAAISEGSTDLVLVGTDGEALIAGGDDTDGITLDSELSDLGPGTWRRENAEILCAAWSWIGDDDIVARRRRAEQLARDCAGTVYADRSLGGLLVEPGLADVTAYRYRLRQTNRGAIARVTFTVTFSALLV